MVPATNKAIADPTARIEQLEDALYQLGFELQQLGMSVDDIEAAIGADRIEAVAARWSAGLKWERGAAQGSEGCQ